MAIVDGDFHVLADERHILEVPQGKRGLSQSNMVYDHTRNLPELWEQAMSALPSDAVIKAVGVTSRPRRRADSYMPAFLAGLGCARSLAAALRVSLFVISHQENHLLAVLRSRGAVGTAPFYGLHLSGGTTDLLYATPDEQGLSIDRIGGSADLSAGQFVDRVGVALDLPFPAGISVDRLARTCTESVKGAAIKIKDGEISFSGVESQAQRWVAAGEKDPAWLCQWTLSTIWRGLAKLLDGAAEHGMTRLAAAGGVMSNSYLRRQLQAYCTERHIDLLLAEDGYSADNATGAAFWAALKERD